MAIERSGAEIARLIDSFLDGSCGEWDWDDFISIGLKSPALEQIRRECAAMPDKYPATEKGHYCNREGKERLREIADELRRESY